MGKKYDFNVMITCRHEDCSPLYKEEIIIKTKKLSKYYSHIVDANVILDKQHSCFRVEVSLQVPGLVISAKHEDYDRTKAFDATYEKVKTQIKKLKSKVVDHRAQYISGYEPVTEEVTGNEENIL
ncbi:ribosome hibernation-promoting factor, HPF/YfiA family [Candidatus Latescibacterota bacterium]